MKVKIVAHPPHSAHVPGEIMDLPESLARDWIRQGWAIARPDLEEKPPEPKVEPPEEKKDDEGEVETAAAPGAPENAMSRRGRARNPAK